MERFLILGNGYVGQHFVKYFCLKEIAVTMANVDICQRSQITDLISQFQPTHMINCAAKTGHPNVDACEKDAEGTYRSNVEGAIVVAEVAEQHQLHLTHLGSGCIYQGDAGGRGFTEEDPPNFVENTYLRSKVLAENALNNFPALQLRLRMPISAVPHRRNLITKLFGFKQIMREPNSATIIEDFVAAAHHLMMRREKGIFNIVNPGLEFHDDLLAMLEKAKGITLGCKVTSFETLQSNLTVKRSNCVLSCEKLRDTGFNMPEFWTSVANTLAAYPMPT